jgi:hypothetical protein
MVEQVDLTGMREYSVDGAVVHAFRLFMEKDIPGLRHNHPVLSLIDI